MNESQVNPVSAEQMWASMIRGGAKQQREAAIKAYKRGSIEVAETHMSKIPKLINHALITEHRELFETTESGLLLMATPKPGFDNVLVR